MPKDQSRIATVLALHGFTLGGAMFADVAARLEARVVAPDLPGHSGRDATNTAWNDAVAEVVELARELTPDVIIGYSMGGRLALNAALTEPAITADMVLVSTSLGIADDALRGARLAADRATAASLESARDADDYLTSFHRSPMVRAPRSTIDLQELRSQTSATGLRGALRGMGQGSQPYVADRLPELSMRVTWMAGAEDEKYRAIAQEAGTRCRHGSVVVVPESGHNVVAERPEAVADAIRDAVKRRLSQRSV